MKKTLGEKIYIGVCYLIILVMCVLTLYPFIYLVSASFSSATSVMKNEVFLFPKNFTIRAYSVVFKYKGIWTAYLNTIFYTVVGTVLSLLMTILLMEEMDIQCLINMKKFFLLLKLIIKLF